MKDYSISELATRYNVSRQTIYNKLASLGLKEVTNKEDYEKLLDLLRGTKSRSSFEVYPDFPEDVETCHKVIKRYSGDFDKLRQSCMSLVLERNDLRKVVQLLTDCLENVGEEIPEFSIRETDLG